MESLSSTDIHPKEQVSVVLKIENDGDLPVIMRVGRDNSDAGAESRSSQYTAAFPVMAGVSNGTIRLGWLELHGSTLKPSTVVSLRPREWIMVRGNIKVHNWYEAGQRAEVYSELLLSKRFPRKSAGSQESCFKQVPGSSIGAQFKPSR